MKVFLPLIFLGAFAQVSLAANYELLSGPFTQRFTESANRRWFSDHDNWAPAAPLVEPSNVEAANVEVPASEVPLSESSSSNSGLEVEPNSRAASFSSFSSLADSANQEKPEAFLVHLKPKAAASNGGKSKFLLLLRLPDGSTEAIGSESLNGPESNEALNSEASVNDDQVPSIDESKTRITQQKEQVLTTQQQEDSDLGFDDGGQQKEVGGSGASSGNERDGDQQTKITTQQQEEEEERVQEEEERRTQQEEDRTTQQEEDRTTQQQQEEEEQQQQLEQVKEGSQGSSYGGQGSSYGGQQQTETSRVRNDNRQVPVILIALPPDANPFAGGSANRLGKLLNQLRSPSKASRVSGGSTKGGSGKEGSKGGSEGGSKGGSGLGSSSVLGSGSGKGSSNGLGGISGVTKGGNPGGNPQPFQPVGQYGGYGNSHTPSPAGGYGSLAMRLADSAGRRGAGAAKGGAISRLGTKGGALTVGRDSYGQQSGALSSGRDSYGQQSGALLGGGASKGGSGRGSATSGSSSSGLGGGAKGGTKGARLSAGGNSYGGQSAALSAGRDSYGQQSGALLGGGASKGGSGRGSAAAGGSSSAGGGYSAGGSSSAGGSAKGGAKGSSAALSGGRDSYGNPSPARQVKGPAGAARQQQLGAVKESSRGGQRKSPAAFAKSRAAAAAAALRSPAPAYSSSNVDEATRAVFDDDVRDGLPTSSLRGGYSAADVAVRESVREVVTESSLAAETTATEQPTTSAANSRPLAEYYKDRNSGKRVVLLLFNKGELDPSTAHTLNGQDIARRSAVTY